MVDDARCRTMGRVYIYVGAITVLGTIALVAAGVSSRLDGILGPRPSGFIILAVLLIVLSRSGPAIRLRHRMSILPPWPEVRRAQMLLRKPSHLKHLLILRPPTVGPRPARYQLAYRSRAKSSRGQASRPKLLRAR